MKRILYFGAAALGFLFTACQSDDITPENGQSGNDGDKTFYVNMRISGDPSSINSRGSQSSGNPDATLKDEDGNGVDFADGTENGINNAFFVFYDNDGNVVGDLVQVELDKLTPDQEAHGETVEKCYKSTVAVTVRKGAQKPAQVICYINPIQPANLSERLNIIQTVARDDIYTNGDDGKRYFAMSNSVYYPEEKDGGEPQVAVKIPELALYSTEQGAKDALEDLTNKNIINIYVERYATKLKFHATDATPYQSKTRVYAADGSSTTPSVELEFEPQFWALNAEAKQSYVIKSFREESSIGDILINNYTYDRLNGRINDGLSEPNAWWDWNEPDYHRSYWAMSPAYFQSEYPDVRSDLDGITNLKQSYLPYNYLGEDKGHGYKVTNEESGNDKKAHYFKETTVGRRGIESNNPAAAVASVIYVGKYNLSVGDVKLKGNPTFYSYLRGTVEVDGQTYDRPYIFFDGKDNKDNTLCLESEVAGGGTLLKRMFAQSTILYRKTGAGTGSDSFERLVISNPEDVKMLVESGLRADTISDKVKELAGTVDADGKHTILKLRNNARALQFPDTYETGNNGIYIVTQNGYKKIVSDAKTDKQNDEVGVTEANLALMRQVGMAYKYVTGHAYFSIPVKHLGWYRTGNKQKNDTKIDWSKVRVGDFGMVRNHSYSIEVTEITGLADGIGDDASPIVPPSTSEDYYMAYAVRILKWAVVPTQKVTL